ncbi:vacuolar amino acid transporter 7 [Suhomyces tanzawaensis NRRL Y-17324]|uniref:Vacuolar amino acid transporter 7 n=1 Tax=Suhomyces tanzawaensis NRRL Y-17324 TaxID=984487 RepID=A0A1E4SQI8_9ASCO|nr:vacuolar amino acid transporter 7 [Suhomyces tanzawaensis NRRL Y-17324]ODV81771.1 vacuolar amino acid transporter 7 [Suhomyces tanzawaensis NRRL Y-17324]
MPTIVQGASTASSSISLTKTIVGAGLLSMPLAFSTDGLVFGVFIILLAASTSGYGLFLQAYVSRYVPSKNATFFNLCSITYPALSVVFDFAIAIQCFGSALSYLVLIGEIMPTIVHHIPLIAPEHYRTFWVLASGLICVPLSFLKNLDSLKYTSILGLVAIAYMVLLVIFHFVAGDVPQDLRGTIGLFPESASGVFSTFSIIVFAYTGHQNMFSIVNESNDRSLSNLTRVISLAVVVSSALFLLVGVSGYLTFGDLVSGNVILLYPAGWTTTLGRFSIVFMVIFSFPLMFHPARISVNNIVFWVQTNVGKSQPEEQSTTFSESTESTALLGDAQELQAPKPRGLVVPFPDRTFVIITLILLIVAYVLAISVTSFAFVLAIVGATGSTAISFILPGLFGYKLIGSELDDPSVLETIFKNLSLGLTIWGFVVMVLCLYTTITGV